MTIQRNFKLALTAGHSIPLVINANQYDSGEQWIFTLYNDGVKYNPSSAAIVGIKSDRLGIINTGTVDGNGRVVINETRQMTAAVGKNIFELLIDDQTHGTANFMVLVEPRPGDNADLSESDYSLFEEAIQGTSQAAIIAGVQDWMDENLTDPTDPIVDASLTLSGAAADAKKTGDEISALKSAIAQGGSFNAEVKSALMTLFEHIGGLYTDANARTYIENLRSALYPPVGLEYITAVYTQTSEVFETTPLDDLKTDLVVTAHYDDNTTEEVTNYVLTGTLTVGTSTITVTYSGKTTVFNVMVSEIPVPYNLNFKFSDIDLSDGYIDDDGSVVSATGNTYYDELIPAIGFWLVSSSGTVYKGNQNLYLRLAEYNSSKSFIKREAIQQGDPAVGDGTGLEFIKMGFNYADSVLNNADRFVACNILDTSICTIPNSTIDTNGDVQPNTGSSISDFLPINEGIVICQLIQSQDSALVVFYDENKTLISRNAVTNALSNKRLSIQVPSNAVYVRFRCPINPVGAVYVSYVK